MSGWKTLGRRKWQGLGLLVALGVWMAVPAGLRATEMTTVRVLVKDAKSGDPIYQAHLTLAYSKSGGFMRQAKTISYSSKTDKKGLGSFPFVPMGKITLMVSAPDHSTFGKVFRITKENQLIEVRLKKPKPQL